MALGAAERLIYDCGLPRAPLVNTPDPPPRMNDVAAVTAGPGRHIRQLNTTNPPPFILYIADYSDPRPRIAFNFNLRRSAQRKEIPARIRRQLSCATSSLESQTRRRLRLHPRAAFHHHRTRPRGTHPAARACDNTVRSCPPWVSSCSPTPPPTSRAARKRPAAILATPRTPMLARRRC